MTLAPAQAPEIEPSPPRRLRKRVVAASLIIGLASVGVGLNLDAVRHLSSRITPDEGSYYPSSRFMAEHIDGCLDTFRPAALPGGSATSGECDLPNGAHIEFRTYDSQEAVWGWADGARGQSGRLEESGAGGIGSNWAFRVTGTTDRDALNAIFLSLPESTPDR